MQDFQFRQMKKTRVFDSPDDLPKDRSSLLAISNKFGLTFVGLDRKIKVYLTGDILASDKVDGNSNEIGTIFCTLVILPRTLPVHNLGLSSDELTLSVSGMSEASGLSLAFYDVRTFINKARPQKLPFATLQLRAGLGIIVQDLKWNPVQVSMLATCLSDGSMMVLEVTDSITVQAQLPATAGITCICWSPKGKQVAAGKMNATVSQYTPGLQEKKVIPCPSFYSSDNPVKVLDVQWLSTFVFAVAYAAADGCPETPPELVVISLPTKTEKREERYLNFNDPVYGTCTERQHHYFLSHIEDWDVVLAASAASIEVSVIAKQEDKTNWELWLLEDASRGELPVSQNNDDTLPLGMAIDYTSQQEIHITDEKTLPPAPTLLLLSTDGVLCPFSLLNFNPGVNSSPLCIAGSAAPPPPYPTSSLPSAPAAFPPLRLPLATTPNPPPPASVSLFTAAPAPASSSGFSFSMPPSSTAPPAFFLGGSTAFSASPALGTSGSFSFSSKPLTETPAAASAFSVSAPKLPVVEMAPVPAPTPKPIPQRLATASPIMVLRGTPEPTTLAVKMNLNDRKSSHVPDFIERPIWFINVASCRLCSSQIAHFQKELDDLKARSHKADFRVGTTEEMKELRKESEDLHVFTLEIKDTTESLHGDISTLKTTMLEGFAGAEDAKAQSELNRHRGYLQLLYKKPLDPRSEDQLKEIRRLYQYVKFAVEDVNDVLDLEWEKHLEKKKKQKHMIVPEREALFTALANNLDIINQQKQRLDTLVKDLHALRLYNKTAAWSTPAPSQPCHPSLRDALLKASLETIPKTTSKSPAKMSPMKQSQLRNFLSKRQTPPVRSTAPANLSRSAFLSPKYYADLDDVSSTSSLSQALDPEYSHYFAEEEPEPAPLPMLPLSMPRHPTVVRTPSIAPGFGAIQSTPFSKVRQGLGLSPIMSPGRKLLSLFDFYLTRLDGEQQVIQLCSCEVSWAKFVNLLFISLFPVKDVSKFSFSSAGGSTGKMMFGSSTAEEPFSFTPKSTSPALGANGFPTPLPSMSGEPVKPTSITPTLRVEPQAPKVVGGETLGSFSGLRVGQGDEEKPSAAAFSFGQPDNGAALGLGTGAAQFSFGLALQQGKLAEAAFGEADSTLTDLSKAAFKPPEPAALSVTKPVFSTSAATSFSSLLAAPLSSPSTTLEKEHHKTPTTPADSTPPLEPSSSQPSPSVSPPIAEPEVTTSPESSVTPTPTIPEKAPTPPAPPATSTTSFPPASITPPAQAAPSTTPEPVHESTPAPEASPPAITPTPEAPPLAYPAPSSDKPGSIFTQPPAVIAVSTTVAVTSLTPVINTAAPASTTPTNSNSVFGQPAPASAAAGGFGSTGFGAPLATGAAAGFGKPVFGQTVGGFGQPAANVAGGFGFGQSAFGANPGFGQPAVASPAAVASTAASGGGLFGALSVSNASGFSFGSPSASTASSTGTGLFGQPSATPAFGQQSAGFGQGSAFGSNTTTTSSTGFSFGQTAGPAQNICTAPISVYMLYCYKSTAITPLLTSVCPTGGPTLFGNSGAKTFGFGSPASTFGGGEQAASGTFSTGGGSVAAQGFGSFSTPAKQTGGFGSAPVFGSPPAFGGSPAFGGAAAFGSAPSFSSPMGSSASKVFGEGTAAANVGGFGVFIFTHALLSYSSQVSIQLVTDFHANIKTLA
uniref:Nuclear pore complex protein Nup214 n=1 Tax=Oncorhynchus kisutch TaxID=8019 RepID=A0A8C7DQR7_ONCKI